MATRIYKPVNDEFISYIGKLCNCNLETGPWIAGGSARLLWFGEDYTDHDIDIFFPDVEKFRTIYRVMEEECGCSAFNTSNASTFTLSKNNREIKVQLITNNWYNTLDKLFYYFDFTVCRFATDGITVVSDVQTIEHCKQKQLHWNITSTQEVSPYRVIKYSGYGFDIDNWIFKRLVQKYLDHPQLFKIDEAYNA